jgi:heme/copper-type cytochrome/quinol oxidase subunit 2
MLHVVATCICCACVTGQLNRTNGSIDDKTNTNTNKQYQIATITTSFMLVVVIIMVVYCVLHKRNAYAVKPRSNTARVRLYQIVG